MAARTKPLNVISPVEQEPLSSVVKFELPDAKSGCKYLEPENMDELVDYYTTKQKLYNMSVVVFVEVKNKVSKAAMEAVYYGSKLGSVTVVTYGDSLMKYLKN